MERILYAKRDSLRKKALPMIEARMSNDDLAHILNSSSDLMNDEADELFERQQRRRAAKLRAEAERRWMVMLSDFLMLVANVSSIVPRSSVILTL
jgi:hypothetical protein